MRDAHSSQMSSDMYVDSRRGRMWTLSETKAHTLIPSLVISRLTYQSYVTICIHRANTSRSSASSLQRKYTALVILLPHDAMRKHGLSCRPVSVCPSATLVH